MEIPIINTPEQNDNESDTANTHKTSLENEHNQVARTIPNDTEINRALYPHSSRSSLDGERLVTKPNVTIQNKLWTEIDALDDVKKLASDPILYDGFAPEFEEQLTKVRSAHARLLQVMRERNAKLEEQQRRDANMAQIQKLDEETRSGSEDIKRDTIKSSSLLPHQLDSSTGQLNSSNNGSNAIIQSQKEHQTSSMGDVDITEQDKLIQEMITIVKDLRT